MRSYSIALVAVLLLAVAGPPASAESLSKLTWEDSVDRDVRAGVRSALEKEVKELATQTNGAGKKYIRVFTNRGIDFDGDKPTTYLTIQRCLDERMASERWKYTFEKKGRDYEIANREKVFEIEDAFPTVVESGDKARQIKPFVFEHDLLNLRMDSGWYIASTWQDQPLMLRVVGKGHMKLPPLNEIEKIFFQRRLKVDTIDTDIEALEISFHPDNQTFRDLIGYAAAGGAGAPSDVQSELRSMASNDLKQAEERAYSPNNYAPRPRVELEKNFGIRIKTKNHGWLSYSYYPTLGIPQLEVILGEEGATFSLRSSDRNDRLVSNYPGPEARKMSRLEMEHRSAPRYATPLRYDAQFDVASDKFAASMDIDLQVLQETNELSFSIGGNPSVEYVKLDGWRDLLFVPEFSSDNLSAAFEASARRYRVLLPEKVPAGTVLRVSVAYDSPDIVDKFSDGFWYIERGGFLPFMGTLDEHAALRFVIRTKEPYTHISIGQKLSEEVVGGYRYTEWGADRLFNFPTMIIGKYLEPVVREVDGVKFTGYMTQSFLGSRGFVAKGSRDDYSDSRVLELPQPNRAAMDEQVMQAAESMRLFSRMFGLPYPFREMKLVGTPAQGFSAQSPTSIIYVGEPIFWPTQFLANFGRDLMGPGFDPMWTRAVTAHENGHQWFGGRVSSVNYGSYWFVETLTELSAFFYTEAIKEDVVREHTLNYWRSSGMSREFNGPVSQPWRAGIIYYTKGPFVWNMLRYYFDKETVVKFLRSVLLTYDGDLISTANLRLVANKVFGDANPEIGRDMDWFFDQYIEGMGIPEVKFRFDSPQPAEDGKGWIITGRLEQEIKVEGKTMDGWVFKNLLVPIEVETDQGTQTVKEFLNEPGKDLRIRVEGKPSRSPKVNPNDEMWMTTRAL